MKISTRCENSCGLHAYTTYKWTEDTICRVALAAILCDMDNMISVPFVIVVFRCR